MRSHKRIGSVVKLAFAPIPEWHEWLQMVAALLVLIGLPGLSQFLESGWTLRDGLEASLIVALLAVFIAAYRLHYQIDQIMDGAPRLICKGTSMQQVGIHRVTTELSGSPIVPKQTLQIVGNPFFHHLKIANEPTGISNRKIAEKVAARVQLFHEHGTPAADERLMRWEHSPGPAEAGKMADTLLPIDIPPSGVEYKLDIAMKYDEDESFHTPNNETVIRDSFDWREEEFKFPPGTYIAVVHLRGSNVVSDLRCQIVNKGRGSRLVITPL